MSKHYYLIETTSDEFSSDYEYIAESFEEAESKIMDYGDWYCDKGTCTILEVDNKFNTLRKYEYWKGNLFSINGNRLNLGRHK